MQEKILSHTELLCHFVVPLNLKSCRSKLVFGNCIYPIVIFRDQLMAVTTFLPVFASNSFIATYAAFPPCFATFLLSSKVSGLVATYISFVEASASIFKISSVLVMLSLRFSFFKPLSILYSLVVLSLHALVPHPALGHLLQKEKGKGSNLILVSVANCCPSFNPRFFHSSVSSFRISILFNRWFIQFSE